MTHKQFIEKAVEGGWEPPKRGIDIENLMISGNKYLLDSSIANMLLDPKAFQAVGKTEGWDKEELTIDYKDGHNPWNSNWELSMHQMIDAIIAGKSIEEFLQTL